jgi:hypothetical protein
LASLLHTLGIHRLVVVSDILPLPSIEHNMSLIIETRGERA